MSETIPNQNSAPRFTNRLAQEKSPYLLQHAHNPVDWFPWGPEALEAARSQDKPIFLSIGYSACHWCHVMERESFENEAVAQIVNSHFIPIKVDREERPDLDEIYMTAVQMMTGHGGWPLSAFLLPDGRPFYGGTYFPPESRQGRIGFPQLVSQLADAYENRREEVERVAESIMDDLRQATRQRPLSAPAGAFVPQTFVDAALREMVERFDEEHGGFGGAPKFPPHHALRLLCELLLSGDTPETQAPDSDTPRAMLSHTLDQMALGGIYDHIGGGFHRYSTDAVWLLPHFEKMLYDNALLARVYAQAYQITGREAYARVARETCDWVLRDMTDPGGGFHAALDADSEGEEGKYYVWTPGQVQESLDAEEDAILFCQRYNIIPGGNFRDEATGHRPGTSIPHLAAGNPTAVLPETLEPRLIESRDKLRQVRDRRVPPGKDDKVITSWNGLMIGALAYAGKAFGEPRYLEAAKRAANFCRTTLRPNGELLRRYARGEAGLPAFLDDHAYLADGLLDLFDATGEQEWQDEAYLLTDAILKRFWDPEDGGFFFSGTGHEALITRSKDLFDGALPSANGVATRVLTRLGKFEGGDAYREKARAILHIYRGMLHRAPQGTHTLILAAREAFPANGAESMEPVTLTTETNAVTVTAGAQATLVFSLQMAANYHVQSQQPGLPHLIPTLATVATNAPAAVGPVGYPEADTTEIAGDTLSVYHGTVSFTVPVSVADNALPGEYDITLSVRCQPCSESACLPPVELMRTVRIVVTRSG
ncbi:MAG: thioredoxin domain-containing protein [Armatimonadaceae bacterium]